MQTTDNDKEVKKKVKPKGYKHIDRPKRMFQNKWKAIHKMAFLWGEK